MITKRSITNIIGIFLAIRKRCKPWTLLKESFTNTKFKFIRHPIYLLFNFRLGKRPCFWSGSPYCAKSAACFRCAADGHADASRWESICNPYESLVK
jgi:hypothetical protein